MSGYCWGGQGPGGEAEEGKGAKQGARGPRHHCVLTVTQPQSIHMVCVHTSSSHGQNTLSTIAQQGSTNIWRIAGAKQIHYWPSTTD